MARPFGSVSDVLTHTPRAHSNDNLDLVRILFWPYFLIWFLFIYLLIDFTNIEACSPQSESQSCSEPDKAGITFCLWLPGNVAHLKSEMEIHQSVWIYSPGSSCNKHCTPSVFGISRWSEGARSKYVSTHSNVALLASSNI